MSIIPSVRKYVSTQLFNWRVSLSLLTDRPVVIPEYRSLCRRSNAGPCVSTEYLEVVFPYSCTRGESEGGYFFVEFLNTNREVVRTRLRWISDFSGRSTQAKIVCNAGFGAAFFRYGYCINKGFHYRGRSSSFKGRLPILRKIVARRIANCTEQFEEKTSFHHAWENVNLEENYTSIVGIKSVTEFAKRSHYLASLLKSRGLSPDSRILDVGCGTGNVPAALNGFFESGNYAGIDVHPRVIKYCKTKFPEHSFYQIENNRISCSGPFDFIVFFSVFTHCLPEEVRGYLEQCRTKLAKSGQIMADIFMTDTIDFTGGAYKAEYRKSYFNKIVEESGLRILEPSPIGNDGGQKLFTMVNLS